MALFPPRQEAGSAPQLFLSLPLTNESPAARRPATGFPKSPAIGAVMHSLWGQTRELQAWNLGDLSAHFCRFQ